MFGTQKNKTERAANQATTTTWEFVEFLQEFLSFFRKKKKYFFQQQQGYWNMGPGITWTYKVAAAKQKKYEEDKVTSFSLVVYNFNKILLTNSASVFEDIQSILLLQRHQEPKRTEVAHGIRIPFRQEFFFRYYHTNNKNNIFVSGRVCVCFVDCV